MHRRVLGFIIILLLVVPCWAFDTYHSPFPGITDEDEWVDFEGSIVRVETFGAAKGVLPSVAVGKTKVGSGLFEMAGSGFVVKGNYIITAAHVVMPDAVKIKTSEHVFWIVPVLNVIWKKIIVDDYLEVEVVWVDVRTDLAVLKPLFKEHTLKPLPFPMGSRFLKAGDATSVMAKEMKEDGFGSWWELRQGKVISPYPDSPVPVPGTMRDIYQAALETTDVTISNKLYPGDSGSPLIAYDNGQPIIIGVVTKMMFVRVGPDDFIVHYYAARIDQAARVIYSLLEEEDK